MKLLTSSVQKQRVYAIFNTATFTLYVTACRGPNLKKSFIFGKELRL